MANGPLYTGSGIYVCPWCPLVGQGNVIVTEARKPCYSDSPELRSSCVRPDNHQPLTYGGSENEALQKLQGAER